MANVYFRKISSNTTTEQIKIISRELLEQITTQEKIKLEKEIPLKVHFGEPGNNTYLKPENYDGVIEFLENKKIKSSFIETSVLYGGKRYKEELHLETARTHGFTKLPVVIADGSHGQDFDEIPIDKTHYKTCKLGREFSKYKQLIVIAHFKGHALAGFGGALKQLSMGFAAKGGKLSMHMGIKPRIKSRKCKHCNLCKTRCRYDALTIGKDKTERSFINHDKCVGCGACVAICPHKAITIFSVKGILRFIGINNHFPEKLAEYAYAAHHGRSNIYLNYVMNITKGCDCEGKNMVPIMEDIGIFASTDPVAIDKACYDIVQEKGKKFRGSKIFAHAQKIGLGSTTYDLIEV